MSNKRVKKHLSEITNEELLKLFRIARGVYEDNYSIENVERWSACDIMVTAGYMKISFGIITCCENDARLPDGYSFVMREHLSKDKLTVSENGIESNKEDFTLENFVLVKNQNLLFVELEKMGYL
jgi:hypothetical protein